MTETKLPAWMPPQATCHPGCQFLDLAVGLLWIGYAPFPLGPEKRPLAKWGEFHVARPGWRHVCNDWLPLWREAQGVGIVTGRPHGLVVVDADSDAAWQWMQEHLPAVRGVKSRRGGHLHFAHPPKGIIGIRTGEQRGVAVAPGIKLDVLGLAASATAPYSRHRTGITYSPLGDWTIPVSGLPVLPDVIAKLAADHPPITRPYAPPTRPRGEPADALRAYLRKVGGLPAEGSGSDTAVFQAAAWAKANRPDLSEAEFAAVICEFRPEFQAEWIARKWRSSRGAA